MAFFTIGHSSRTLDDFAGLLVAAGVTHLVDVRTVPRSRANPQFNGADLPAALSHYGISYAYAPDLGGLRGKSRETPAGLNGYWTNESFHNYADYALTEPFAAALTKLVEVGHRQVSAVMCAEAVWWRCHRRVIADYLLARGEEVFHLMGDGRSETARLTPGACVRPDLTIVYPAPG
ncbi:MAG: DUF488 domain-containing protein [Rhizobiaceae bacterium]|nr:DUF488 domain-containing protein [Rhizobiaceae bacterium]